MKKMLTLLAFVVMLFSGCVGTLVKNEVQNRNEIPTRNVKPKSLKIKADNNQSKIILEKKSK